MHIVTFDSTNFHQPFFPSTYRVFNYDWVIKNLCCALSGSCTTLWLFFFCSKMFDIFVVLSGDELSYVFLSFFLNFAEWGKISNSGFALLATMQQREIWIQLNICSHQSMQIFLFINARCLITILIINNAPQISHFYKNWCFYPKNDHFGLWEYDPFWAVTTLILCHFW